MKVHRNVWLGMSFIHLYLPLIIRAMTVRKAWNLVLLGFDYLFGRPVPAGLPAILKLETTNRCNLRCAGCMHGATDDPALNRDVRQMSVETCREILDQVSGHTILMYLYHGGEPFINKNILEFCRMAKAKGVATAISTNLSLPLSDDFIDKIVTSGLGLLTVSIDGTTQDIYERYRIGGKLDLVMGNLRRLAAAKRRLGACFPLVNWQFIAFDHNIHQIEDAIRLAEDAGCHVFSSIRDARVARREGIAIGGAANEAKIPERFPFRCKWLWSTSLVFYDGGIVPCCHYDWRNKKEFGSIGNPSFAAVWRGKEYAANRRIVAGAVSPRDAAGAYCVGCPLNGPDL